MLLIANFFWGLSFPLIKSITLLHAKLVPQAGTLPVARVAPDALTPAPDAVVARWLKRLHRVADLGGIDLDEVLT